MEKYNARKLGWLHDAVFLIILVAAVFILFRYVIGIAVVGGSSMEPTLSDQDLVVYSRIVPEYQAGETVVDVVYSRGSEENRTADVIGSVVQDENGDYVIEDISDLTVPLASAASGYEKFYKD